MLYPTTHAYDRPVIARPWLSRTGQAGLLAVTALLYLWDLDKSGFANDYYAAAAQAGASSWKAFLFGSLDAGNAITVDKTPLALWPMALSVRAFGLSSFSILLPQALEGIATVAILSATVRRSTRSPAAGLLAGSVLALTPVAALVFRYDNPDAMLTLLVVSAAASTLRAVESDAAGWWLSLAGALVGLGFLAKMLEVLLVVPALVATYAVWARVPVRRRIVHLVAAAGATLTAAGWWVVLVQLWPASQRPWIGGSSSNSVLEVVLGYNGIGRLTGSETTDPTSVAGWRLADAGHLFTLDVGGAALWLAPAAVLLGVGGLVVTRPGVRDRPVRSGLMLWLVWLGTVFATFSLMTGIFHSYYVVLLSPAVAAAVAVGGHRVWRARQHEYAARVVLCSTAVVTAVLSFLLLAAAPGALAQLRWVVPTVLVVASVGLIRTRASGWRARGWAAVAVVAALAAPLDYTLATVAAAHTGSGPHAGPGQGNAAGEDTDLASGVTLFLGGLHVIRSLGHGATYVSDPAVADLLTRGADGYRWTAATGGAPAASSLELASGAPVMAIGGYKGTDPTPDLSTFVEYVERGEVHYFVADDSSGPAELAIADWVASRFVPMSISDVTVYDLSAGQAH